jgi:hypothetical protein
MPSPGDKPLMRSIGEFFGEVWKGVKTDPGQPRIARRTVEQRTVDTESGRVILRRTVIEEVITPPPGDPQAPRT